MAMRYDEVRLKFLEVGYKTMRVPELTDAFNREFQAEASESQIKSTLKRYGLKSGRLPGLAKGERLKHTPEQLEYVKKAYRSKTHKEIAEEFNAKFGGNETAATIKGLTYRHGFKSGRTGRFKPGNVPPNKGLKGFSAGGRSVETQFKKGCVPVNKKPIGSERIDTDGYLLVKVAEPNKWRPKHNVIWEEANGKRPSNHVIRFRDGNKSNVKLDNLVLVSLAENGILNKVGIVLIPEKLEEEIRLVLAIHRKRHQVLKRNTKRRGKAHGIRKGYIG